MGESPNPRRSTASTWPLCSSAGNQCRHVNDDAPKPWSRTKVSMPGPGARPLRLTCSPGNTCPLTLSSLQPDEMRAQVLQLACEARVAREDEDLASLGDAGDDLQAARAALRVPVHEDLVDEQGQGFGAVIEVIDDRQA